MEEPPEQEPLKLKSPGDDFLLNVKDRISNNSWLEFQDFKDLLWDMDTWMTDRESAHLRATLHRYNPKRLTICSRNVLTSPRAEDLSMWNIAEPDAQTHNNPGEQPAEPAALVGATTKEEVATIVLENEPPKTLAGVSPTEASSPPLTLDNDNGKQVDPFQVGATVVLNSGTKSQKTVGSMGVIQGTYEKQNPEMRNIKDGKVRIMWTVGRKKSSIVPKSWLTVAPPEQLDNDNGKKVDPFQPGVTVVLVQPDQPVTRGSTGVIIGTYEKQNPGNKRLKGNKQPDKLEKGQLRIKWTSGEKKRDKLQSQKILVVSP